MKLPIEPIEHVKAYLRDFFPEIENEQWLRDRLMTDFRDLTFYPPANLKLNEIANVEGNIYKKKENCILKLRTKKTDPGKLTCMAKEIVFSDGKLVGYSLFVRPQGTHFLPIVNTEKGHEVRYMAENKSQVEWMYNFDNCMFVRTDSRISKARANAAVDWDALNSSSQSQSQSQDSTGLLAASSGGMLVMTKKSSILTSDKEMQEVSEEQDSSSSSASKNSRKGPENTTVFARIAKKLGKEWNKPVLG